MQGYLYFRIYRFSILRGHRGFARVLVFSDTSILHPERPWGLAEALVVGGGGGGLLIGWLVGWLVGLGWFVGRSCEILLCMRFSLK